MPIFRPSFDSYKSPREFKRERETEARHAEERRIADQLATRRKAYGLVMANLPLLERYVEKSPVDITYYSRIKSVFQAGLVGGWPVGFKHIPGRDSYHGTIPERDLQLVVTEDYRFGYAHADRERSAFRLHDPIPLNENNFISYSILHNPGSSNGTAYVPSAENIKCTLQELLTGTGIQPNQTVRY